MLKAAGDMSFSSMVPAIILIFQHVAEHLQLDMDTLSCHEPNVCHWEIGSKLTHVNVPHHKLGFRLTCRSYNSPSCTAF